MGRAEQDREARAARAVSQRRCQTNDPQRAYSARQASRPKRLRASKHNDLVFSFLELLASTVLLLEGKADQPAPRVV